MISQNNLDVTKSIFLSKQNFLFVISEHLDVFVISEHLDVFVISHNR